MLSIVSMTHTGLLSTLPVELLVCPEWRLSIDMIHDNYKNLDAMNNCTRPFAFDQRSLYFHHRISIPLL